VNNYSKLRVGLVGLTGYAGQELALRLARHPAALLVAAQTSGRGGAAPRRLGELLPAFAAAAGQPAGRVPADLEVAAAAPAALLAARPDVVFLCLPHEPALAWVPQLLAAPQPPRVIDLSGAFRFPDPAVFARWYGLPHTAPDCLAAAVYGWPEKNRAAIAAARLVANPGCYATAANTALWPLALAGCLGSGPVICDAKSGASGAGRGLRDDLHFVELAGNCAAYGLFQHRHTPEIALHSGLPLAEFTFTPHLLPVRRGILATTYVPLAPGVDAARIALAYQSSYATAAFTRITADRLPDLHSVTGTNFCDLGWRLAPEGGRLIAVTALDNLVKGAAGQALENCNLMFGLPAAAGLL
jgi:N-acetyl-gamma-glutamyl-phosphate reductase